MTEDQYRRKVWNLVRREVGDEDYVYFQQDIVEAWKYNRVPMFVARQIEVQIDLFREGKYDWQERKTKILNS